MAKYYHRPKRISNKILILQKFELGKIEFNISVVVCQYSARLLKKYRANTNTTKCQQVLANTQYPNTGIV